MSCSRHSAGMPPTAAYDDAGIGPEEVDVIELHDCFTSNELATYVALGLCREDELNEFVASGQATYGGRVVVNPSGGLLAKGHPLGATGLAQITELTWQLRGAAGEAPGGGRPGSPAAQRRTRQCRLRSHFSENMTAGFANGADTKGADCQPG